MSTTSELVSKITSFFTGESKEQKGGVPYSNRRKSHLKKVSTKSLQLRKHVPNMNMHRYASVPIPIHHPVRVNHQEDDGLSELFGRMNIRQTPVRSSRRSSRRGSRRNSRSRRPSSAARPINNSPAARRARSTSPNVDDLIGLFGRVNVSRDSRTRYNQSLRRNAPRSAPRRVAMQVEPSRQSSRVRRPTEFYRPQR